MQLLRLAFTIFLLTTLTVFANDEIVSRVGVIRDIRFAENGCEELPDNYKYEAYLELASGVKLCLGLLPEAEVSHFKYYFNQRVRIEGEVYCGYDRMDVLRIHTLAPHDL